MASTILGKALPVPSFADFDKPAKDILTKDFYHDASKVFQVNLKTPSGAKVTVKGKNTHEGAVSASLESKVVASKGITATFTSNTEKSFSGKAEIAEVVAPGVKTEIAANYHLDRGFTDPKATVFYKQPNLHVRALFSQDKNAASSALFDAVTGRDGFIAGATYGYNITHAKPTTLSTAIGYQHPLYSAAILAHNNFSTVNFSFYQKANSQAEVGLKVIVDRARGNTVNGEIAAKYKLDALSFAKARLHSNGTAFLSYNTKVNDGFTFGLGASVNTQALKEPVHKIGASFTFEG